MPPPKRHHYLPIFYQEGFCRNSFLWIYDRKENKFRRDQPINTGVIGKYYTFETGNGEESAAIEEFLAKWIDTPAKNAIDKLVRGVPLTARERSDFSLFLSFLRVRTPDFEKEYKEGMKGIGEHLFRRMFYNDEASDRKLRQMDPVRIVGKEMGFEEFKDYMFSQVEAVPGKLGWLEIMRNTAVRSAEMLFSLRWTVLTAPAGTSFITSDNPFTVVPPPGAVSCGIATPGAIKIVPLTARAVLGMGEPGEDLDCEIVKVPHETVETINDVVAKECDRFVMCQGDEEGRAFLEGIVKSTGIDRWSKGSRVHVSAVGPLLLLNKKRYL